MNLRQSPELFCERGLFLFSYAFYSSRRIKTKFRCGVVQHAELSGAQTASHYQVIPESRQSMESSWNAGKRSGRKAMLSQLGGAATTSSRPACSLDSQSGNSRQDKTHPDTPTAQTRLHRCDRWGWSFALNALSSSEHFFFFFLTLVVKISVGVQKKCWVFGRFQKQLRFMSVVVFYILVLSAWFQKGNKTRWNCISCFFTLIP